MVEENRIPKLNILTIGLYCGGRQFDVVIYIYIYIIYNMYYYELDR